MKTKYLLIGAGISNLTFANYIDDNYIIVEKDSEVGGYCKTIKRNGYVWDYAGHFFHFKTEEFKNRFIESLDEKEFVRQEKKTYIYYKDSLIDYPFQMNIHELPKEEFIDCLYDLFNKEEKEDYDNFLDMLYGKFGKSITEKFLKPYNEKLYACDLTKLDKDAMGRFFPYADKEAIINNMKASKDNSYNNTFLYPKNGAQTIINNLYEKIDKEKVFLNTSVLELDLDNHKATLSNGKIIEYDYLINSIPFNKFLELTNQEKYVNLSKELSYNKVLVLNLGFNKKSNYDNHHWIYYPDKNINFYRAGFYDNILKSDKLSMYIEIGYNKENIIDKNEIEKQLSLTLENLNKTGVIDETFELIDYSVIIMDPAYVHIDVKYDKIVTEIKEELSKNKVYSIGRYGGWTYGSMEDSMLEAKSLAEKIK